MVRHILDWCDRTYEESLEEENEIKPITTAVKVGFVEGLVDGAAILGLLLTAGNVVAIVKEAIKK